MEISWSLKKPTLGESTMHNWDMWRAPGWVVIARESPDGAIAVYFYIPSSEQLWGRASAGDD
jgi:hypothetical protein